MQARGTEMAKISVVVLADTETHADLGRVANALTTVREAKEAGDDVELIFDGAGTKWVQKLTTPGEKLGRAFDGVRDKVAGACAYCARAFGVEEAVRSADIPLLGEYHGHPSLRTRVAEAFRSSRSDTGPGGRGRPIGRS